MWRGPVSDHSCCHKRPSKPRNVDLDKGLDLLLHDLRQIVIFGASGVDDDNASGAMGRWRSDLTGAFFRNRV
jgi:hypothetical protein